MYQEEESQQQMEIIMCTRNKYSIYYIVNTAYTKCAGKHGSAYLITNPTAGGHGRVYPNPRI